MNCLLKKRVNMLKLLRESIRKKESTITDVPKEIIVAK